MLNVKRSTLGAVCAAALALGLAMGLAACAPKTADYGDSNPHDSIHGGYSSCVNCHAKDREITDNQCMHCHDWPHNPGA